MRILIGPDFFGAGNVGDDLMLAGFMEAFGTNRGVELTAGCSRDLASQRRRLPAIQWFDPRQPGALEAAESRADAWISVGGTPFQMSSGPWLLDQVLATARRFRGAGKPVLLIGAGAEREVAAEAGKAREIIAAASGIWTRDPRSAVVLRDLAPGATIHDGQDLAHIALATLFAQKPAPAERPVDVAVTYFTEQKDPASLDALRRFLRRRGQAGGRLLFVANDGRPKQDPRFHRALAGSLLPWRRLKLPLLVPDYPTATLAELVLPWSRARLVLASRLHALVAAAWAGAAPVALARSSKIEMVAQELGLPFVRAPLTEAGLEAAVARAQPVDPAILAAHAASAACAVRSCQILLPGC